MPIPTPVSNEKLEEIAKEYGTPFQLYDEKLIRENAASLIKQFGDAFPGFTEFFAVKALPNPAILQILIDEGCGLDCSSATELYMAQQLGVPGERVMYTSNYTSKEDLCAAVEQGVVINLDDVSLVDDLISAKGRMPELISFRLNPGLGRTDSETKSNVLGGPDAKFGIPPDQIMEAYKKAKAAGSTRFGMHMMTGSCVTNAEYWRETLTVLLETVAKVKEELGINFEFINVGGGLGIPYKLGEPKVDVSEVVRILKETYDEKKKEDMVLNMENGRYMTGPFGWLVSRCHVIKKTTQLYYGLDSCMANLMRPGMYGSYHHISIPAAEARKEGASLKDQEDTVANVVGTLCENNDWFAKARSLPPANVGDLFVIHDSGAHSHSMGFQYNGKLRAPEILLRLDGTTELIRRRETYQDYLGTCVMPKDLQPKKDSCTLM